jgi:nucleoside 2-deoxyribosyltransferase
MRLYLAGPDVFLNNFGAELLGAKKELCARYGVEGVSPMDGQLALGGLDPFAQGVAIYTANVRHMLSCDGVIANMTPFRGISMDVGTAFEMGFMAAAGKPVLGYSNVTDSYAVRAESYYRGRHHEAVDRYTEGTSIESFEMADNLMMAGAVHASGFEVVRCRVAAGQELTALEGFEACLRQLQQRR